MAIRSRISFAAASSAGALPPFFSERAWPGVTAWLRSVACSVGIFGVLASFAWHGSSGRVVDMTTLLVAIPAGALILIVIAAVLWEVLAGVSMTTGLAFIARILPIAWVIPVLQLLVTGGRGVAVPPVPFGGPSYLFVSLTGSLLPDTPAVPMLLRAGIFSVALVTAFVVWFSRERFRTPGTNIISDVLRSLIAFVVMSVAVAKIVFVSTGLAMTSALLRGGGWLLNTDDAAREAVRAVTNGYWWTNIYERFPSAIEQQADIAMRLASSGAMAWALGIILIALFVWRVPKPRALLLHTFRARSAVDLVLIVIGAAIVATMTTTLPTASSVFWWMAPMLGIFALAAFRLHAVLERCLRPVADGVTSPTDPLACGDVPHTVAEDLSIAALLYALLASLALGWPVFAAVLASLAASWLSRDRGWASWPWAATLFRASGAASLALAGFFFASQQARLSTAAILVMVLAAGYQGTKEFFPYRRKKAI